MTHLAAAATRRIRQLGWLAAALCVAVLGVTGGYLGFTHRAAEHAVLQEVELYARVLEGQSTRSIDQAATLLRTSADLVEGGASVADAMRLMDSLQDPLAGQPQLRSLSVLDGDGKVLASSSRENIGVVVPTGPLGCGAGDAGGNPANGRLGALLRVRDLADLANAGGAEAGVDALPLSRRLRTPSGELRCLVALLNPEHFATQYAQTLADDSIRSALLGFDGTLLSAGSAIRRAPGSNVSALQVFGTVASAGDHGSYVGTGIDGDPVVAGFRASRRWPLVTVVERSAAAAMDDWRLQARWGGGFAALGLALIAAAGVAGRRSLTREAHAEARADALAEEVARGEERWKLALEGAGDGVWEWDVGSNKIRLSHRCVEMLGYAEGDVGDSVDDFRALIHPDDAGRVREALRQYLDGRTPGYAVEVRMRGKDGRWRWILMRGMLTRTEQPGSPRRMIGTNVDVTERRGVEQALQDSEARLRATFDQAAVGMMQQGVDRRFLRVNQAMCELLGYTQQELMAMSADALIHPEDVAAGLDGMRRLFAGEIANFTQEKRYRRKDGRYTWVRLNASIARDAGGAPLYMICVVEDVSARRRAQAELAEVRQRELETGARIQQALLVRPHAEELPGLWLSTFSQASLGIDGDFVEVTTLGEHCVDLIVGDVMGKGVNAALMAAATKMQFSHSIAELMADPRRQGRLPQPQEIVVAVHRAMTPNLQSLEAFVTLCYLRIDTVAGTLTWVGCGHEEPLLVRAGGETQTLANQHPPVGVLDALDYAQSTTAFGAHDALFLCSDGVTDAVLPDGTRVGRERIARTVDSLLRLHETPAATLHALRSELIGDGARFTDDVTLLLATGTGNPAPGCRCEMPRSLEALSEIRDTVEQGARQAGIEEAAAGLFTVACVEAFTNIVRHARGGLDDTPVEALMRTLPDRIEVEFVYLGDTFTPPERPPQPPLEEYPQGGFGLSIIDAAADRVEYLHRAGVNTVRLTKLLAAGPR